MDLSRHTVISKTPAFLKYAISSELVIEPSQHPCLQMLPAIFLSAMKGVSGLVDAFLGKLSQLNICCYTCKVIIKCVCSFIL